MIATVKTPMHTQTQKQPTRFIQSKQQHKFVHELCAEMLANSLRRAKVEIASPMPQRIKTSCRLGLSGGGLIDLQQQADRKSTTITTVSTRMFDAWDG
ncbi:MAG: hypothetical protein AAF224_01075 [Pseudomonadota bacterium]